jgi:hypothetical protein
MPAHPGFVASHDDRSRGEVEGLSDAALLKLLTRKADAHSLLNIGNCVPELEHHA